MTKYVYKEKTFYENYNDCSHVNGDYCQYCDEFFMEERIKTKGIKVVNNEKEFKDIIS